VELAKTSAERTQETFVVEKAGQLVAAVQ